MSAMACAACYVTSVVAATILVVHGHPWFALAIFCAGCSVQIKDV